jgi:hypothetical protein
MTTLAAVYQISDQVKIDRRPNFVGEEAAGDRADEEAGEERGDEARDARGAEETGRRQR